jgi:hypothetical protein
MTKDQNKADLLKAYEGVMLLALRRKITREERNARLVAVRDIGVAAGLTFEGRDAIANEAVRRMAEVIDVDSGIGGTWQ